MALGEACTIVLRGASTHILDEAERSLHDALCVLAATVKVRSCLGLVEMFASVLRGYFCHCLEKIIYIFFRSFCCLVRVGWGKLVEQLSRCIWQVELWFSFCWTSTCASSTFVRNWKDSFSTNTLQSCYPYTSSLALPLPHSFSSSPFQDSRVVYGGGCGEMRMAKAVDELAARTPGGQLIFRGQQLGLLAVGRLASILPSIIISNSMLCAVNKENFAPMAAVAATSMCLTSCLLHPSPTRRQEVTCYACVCTVAACHPSHHL